jgi:hypothetical protein
VNHGLAIEQIWDDEHLVELQCSVDTGLFRGTATCYTSHQDVATFAGDVQRFAVSFEGVATFEASLADTTARLGTVGTTAVRIHLHTIDRAKHTAVRVRLVTERGGRPEDVASLELAFSVEAAAIDQFIRELVRLRARGDSAFLRAAV